MLPSTTGTALKPGIFASAEVFLQLIEHLENIVANQEHMQAWCQRIHSVFVSPGADRDSLQKLARILIGNEGALLSEIDPSAENFVVSDRLNDFCGVMTGVRVTGVNCKSNRALILNTGKGMRSTSFRSVMARFS